MIVIAGILLGACEVKEIPVSGGAVCAIIESDHTRTSVTDEGSLTWSAGDKVWLHTTNGGVVGTLSSGAGTASAKFSYGPYFGEMTGKAIHPYNSGHSLSGDELSVVLPASYDLGSVLDNNNAVMYGVNDKGTIRFSHLAGMMRFKFKNVPVGTDKFQITLDKKINGTFTVDLTADYPVLQTEAADLAAEKTVTLNFDALTLVSDICLYVPLPVGTYTALGLELCAGDESIWSYSNTVTNTISRKTLKLMPSVSMGGSVGGDIEGEEPSVPEGPASNEIWYTSSDGGLITPSSSTVFGAKIVSNTYNDNHGVITFDGPVTSIGTDAFYSCQTMVSITLPDSVTKIGSWAFASCTSLGNITIPDSVSTIGERAFSSSGIESVTIGNGVTSIGKYAFGFCRSLTEIMIPESVTTIQSWAFAGCSNLQKFTGKYSADNGRCLIKDSAIISYAESSGATYIIPDSVTKIGEAAFYACDLTDVTLHDNITSIAASAFRECKQLVNINIPDSVTQIGKEAFYSCTKLSDITIGRNVSTIGSSAFSNLSSKQINVYIKDLATWCNISFGNSDSNPLSDNGNLYLNDRLITNLTIPSGVTKVKCQAFSGCASLISVTLPYSVTEIDEYAFSGCSNISIVTLKDRLTKIGFAAFHTCKSLETIDIPSSVTTIGAIAFCNCTKLKKVICRAATPPSLDGTSVFYNNSSDRKFYVPSASISSYKANSGWSQYADYIFAISGDDIEEDSEDFVNLSENGTANSYIVSEAGSYKFIPTKGNSSVSVGAIAYAETLWETFGTDVIPSVGDLVYNVKYDNGVICFKTSDSFREGNAVIAAKDASGKVLWSWHIWLTDQPEGQVYYNNAGTMMDRNLGAVSAAPGDVGALGLLYQWGRKDPFLGTSSVVSSSEAKSTITWPACVESSSTTGTIAYSTANPTTFITYNSYNGDWHYTGSNSIDNTRWTESINAKSIYDPCPAGWRVPDGGDNGVWSKALGSSLSFTQSSLYESAGNGINFSGKFGSDSVIWYPCVTPRSSSMGSLSSLGPHYGMCWSATPVNSYPADAYHLYYNYNGKINPMWDASRPEGLSVRCVQD